MARDLQPQEPQKVKALAAETTNVRSATANTMVVDPAKLKEAQNELQDSIRKGNKVEASLTNEFFYTVFPTMRGKQLSAGTEAATKWVEFRNNFVRPALKTATPVTTDPTTKPPVTTDPATKPPAPDGTQTEQEKKNDKVEAELDDFIDDYTHIKVKVGDKTLNVSPPYHINTPTRAAEATANRKADTAVNELLKQFVKESPRDHSMALIGKASPEHITTILQRAADQGLIFGKKAPTAEEMRNWLAHFGISTDCSGLVSRAFNRLLGKEAFRPDMVISGSYAGGQGDFTEITSPSELRPGDTMCLKPNANHKIGHIRIIVSVDVVKANGRDVIKFKTAESAGSSGPMAQVWTCPNLTDFKGMTNGKGNPDAWGPVFGRYKKL